jgi:hypothetical protein
MEHTVTAWLADVGAASFRWSVLAFFAINGMAAAVVALSRDRALVNRWTGRLLAANLVLVGTGVGIPLVASASRLAVSALFSGTSVVVPQVDRGTAAGELRSPEAPLTQR